MLPFIRDSRGHGRDIWKSTVWHSWWFLNKQNIRICRGSINRYCPGRTPGERRSVYDTKMTYIYVVKFILIELYLNSMIHEERAWRYQIFQMLTGPVHYKGRTHGIPTSLRVPYDTCQKMINNDRVCGWGFLAGRELARFNALPWENESIHSLHHCFRCHLSFSNSPLYYIQSFNSNNWESSVYAPPGLTYSPHSQSRSVTRLCRGQGYTRYIQQCRSPLFLFSSVENKWRMTLQSCAGQVWRIHVSRDSKHAAFTACYWYTNQPVREDNGPGDSLQVSLSSRLI